MNRQLTAIFAGAEALLVVAIGIAIPLAPLTLLWGVQYGFAVDWAIFWRASVDSWLIGHGVDVAISLDPVSAASLGVAGAVAPFTITIAALGFAMLTVLLGVRAGRRVSETGYLVLGPVVSLATFAAASALVTVSALHPFARPSLVQGTVLPTLVFALGLGIGLLAESRQNSNTPWGRMPRAASSLPPEVTATIFASLRAGVGAAALIMTAASVVSAAALLISYGRVIALYEALQTQVIGGVVVTLGQLAFVPNVVIWTASWLIGPGLRSARLVARPDPDRTALRCAAIWRTCVRVYRTARARRGRLFGGDNPRAAGARRVARLVLACGRTRDWRGRRDDHGATRVGLKRRGRAGAPRRGGTLPAGGRRGSRARDRHRGIHRSVLSAAPSGAELG